jgi:hypothetical protein
VVTGVAEGSATITVKTTDGDITATCAVTVTGTQSLSISILGTPKVGETLTADVIKTFSGVVKYQWFRGSDNVTGEPSEQSSQYYLTLEDADKTIKVKVSCGDKAAESSPVTVPNVTYTVEIRETFYPLAAQLKVGDRYCSMPDGFTIQWQRNGSTISGATSQIYILQPTDRGKRSRLK